MVIAIGILLAAVCLAVVVIPFLRYRHSRQTVNPLEMIDGLEEDRRRIYRELLNLKEGYRVGTVPEPEFNGISENLRRRAAERLWIQRRWEDRLQALDQAVEQEVLNYRESEASDRSLTICLECGAEASTSEKSCLLCGASLTEGPKVLSGGKKNG